MITAIIKFTSRELRRTEKTFRQEFFKNGRCAHVAKEYRLTDFGVGCLYTIRYRSNGYRISAQAVDLATAKRLFIEKTFPIEIDKYRVVA